MNSCAPISRLVAPPASSASTCRSRGVRPNGSLVRRRVGGPRRRGAVLQPQPGAGGQALDLVGQPARAERAGAPSPRARAATTVAARGRPARRCASASRQRAIAARVGALERRPRLGGRRPARRVGLALGAARLGRGARRRARARPARSTSSAGGLHAHVSMLGAQPAARRSSSASPRSRARSAASASTRDAGAGHLGQPLAVLAAELDPVDRLLDRRARRRRGRPRGARARRAARRSRPRNCGSSDSASRLAASSSSGRARPSSPRPSGSSARAGCRVGERRAGERGARSGTWRLRLVPVAAARSRSRRAAGRASARRASRDGTRPRGPSIATCSALAAAAGAVQRVGEVGQRRRRRRSSARRRARSSSASSMTLPALLLLAEREQRHAEPVEHPAAHSSARADLARPARAPPRRASRTSP